MISPARRAAYELLTRIECQGVYSDYAVNSAKLDALESRDRHLATELVYGCLRWRRLLDHIIEAASSMPLGRLDPAVLIVLRIALYQLWRMDRVPDHAAVDDAVEMTKAFGTGRTSGFVNGVLRGLARSRPWQQGKFESGLPDAVRVSLPDWLWDRWSARWGQDRAREYAVLLNEPPQRAFWLARGAGPVPDTVTSEIVPGAYLDMGGQLQPDAAVHYQDEASQLIPHLLKSVDGRQIWDACAAPGGKSGILRNSGAARVVSSDIRFGRAVRMAQALRDTGEGQLDVVVADAAGGAPFRTAAFDAVLADVPCSGLGTVRRNPEIKWRFRPEQLGALTRVQREILQAVSSAVRPGGFLLYSTCSTEPEEDEQVVDYFLTANPEFSLIRPGRPGPIEVWLDARGMLHTFPGRRRWDGFFAALMVRSA